MTHFLAVLLAISGSLHCYRRLPTSSGPGTSLLSCVWSLSWFLTVAKVLLGSQVPIYFQSTSVSGCFMAASLLFFNLCRAVVPGLTRLGVSLPPLHLDPQCLPVAPRTNLERLHNLRYPHPSPQRILNPSYTPVILLPRLCTPSLQEEIADLGMANLFHLVFTVQDSVPLDNPANASRPRDSSHWTSGYAR